LAARALGSGDAEVLACGLGLAHWGWQRAPLDRAQTELLLGSAAAITPAPPWTQFLRTLLHTLDAQQPDLAQQQELSALMNSGETALVVRTLLPLLRDPHRGLGWLAAAWDGLLRLGGVDLCRAALDLPNWPDELLPLRARLAAEAAFLLETPERALAELASVDDALFGLWAGYLRAEIALRQGEAEAGRTQLAEIFRALPWHTHLGLKLHGLCTPLATAPAAATEDAVILVYSWNKAGLTKQTLESLARTDYGRARILALNNGSTDETGAVMEACAALFPPGALRVIHLPVNVGAPAARNWLLAQPEVRAAQWAVFLDDDVILPERWLLRLLGAGQAEPDCGAVGCRIVSATPPACLQSADYQLFLPDGQPRTFRDLTENIVVFDNCAGALDLGLFTYNRPATHVSGCCHALRVSVVQELGGFDIRFSPTQFDDLDRDLRSAVAGRPAVYAGDLAIAHVQHSSLAKAKGPAAMGQVFGNKIKLEGKFTQAEVDGAARRGLAALTRDRAKKWNDLVTVIAG
jgi:GT2 family glycosyltransferase